jgi:hypothetical protein
MAKKLTDVIKDLKPIVDLEDLPEGVLAGISVGDMVRVKPPFDVHFPGVYVVEGRNEETGALQIMGGRDFDAVFLEVEP